MFVDLMTCASLSPLWPNFLRRAGKLRNARVVNLGSNKVTALLSKDKLCLMSVFAICTRFSIELMTSSRLDKFELTGFQQFGILNSRCSILGRVVHFVY